LNFLKKKNNEKKEINYKCHLIVFRIKIFVLKKLRLIFEYGKFKKKKKFLKLPKNFKKFFFREKNLI
jgi:hypothetical protein